MVWKGVVYEVVSKPSVYAVTWGNRTVNKLRDLQDGLSKEYSSEKRRVRWPWRLDDGSRGVLCPFTKKIVSELDDTYIRSLPSEYSRYAENLTWEEFISRYPTALIQAELYSLDRTNRDDDSFLHSMVADQSWDNIPDYEDIKLGRISCYYEHTFRTIDECVQDEIDRDILKLIAAGYAADDIVDTLNVEKKEIRRRIRSMRDCKELEQLLRQ
jgi:hypothetical protein